MICVEAQNVLLNLLVDFGGGCRPQDLAWTLWASGYVYIGLIGHRRVSSETVKRWKCLPNVRNPYLLFNEQYTSARLSISVLELCKVSQEETETMLAVASAQIRCRRVVDNDLGQNTNETNTPSPGQL